VFEVSFDDDHDDHCHGDLFVIRPTKPNWDWN
jgi:hypothetical protein